MSINSKRYVRKPFHVESIRVTEENISDVAEWCGGEVKVTEKPEGAQDESFIKVKVFRPLNDRQTKAFIGDHVLKAGTGFKVYTDKAFRESFDAVENVPEELMSVVEEVAFPSAVNAAIAKAKQAHNDPEAEQLAKDDGCGAITIDQHDPATNPNCVFSPKSE